MQFQPLLADIGGLIGIIIWVVIMIISAIGKAGGGKKAAPPKKRPMGQPGMGGGGMGGGGMGGLGQARPQGGLGGQPRAQGQPGQKSIELEIEDFLRQARGGNAAPAAPPRQPARQPPPRDPRPAGRVVEAKPVDRDIVPGQGFGKSVSKHVREHITQDSISTRDAGLADVIENADERIEHHLEEVFDHDVGHLYHVEEVDTSIAEGTDAKTLDEAEADRMETANRIREMLGSPASIREVFIASEILKRPEV